jgi:RimJ/RimL family protein N-acetyltransferase
VDPLLIDVPERLLTERFIARCPQPGDGPAINAAVCETLGELRPWMPWAQAAPMLGESESHARRANAKFRLREDLVMFIFERLPGDREGRLLGGSGLHRMNWETRSFEIGYWRRTGCGQRGVITEVVLALTRLCFDALAAQRVEIRMDDGNLASRRVAERAGFTLEGVLRRDSVTPLGEPRDTRVYSRVRGAEEPQA